MSAPIIEHAHSVLTTLGRLDQEVRTFMRAGVVAIPEDASIRTLQRAMTGHGVHAVLVVRRSGGDPLGWVTARGLLDWIGGDNAMRWARDAIDEPVVEIDPSASARSAVDALRSGDATHLLVRSRGGQPEGVVSDRDLVELDSA